MSDLIQLRRGYAASWTVQNPILADGELGLERDTRLFKVGNGILHWNDLPYYLTGPKGDTGNAGSASIWNERPAGVKDGTNRVFTTSTNFIAQSTRVTFNGYRIALGSDEDYTETASNEITFNSEYIIKSTDKIIIDYDPQTILT